MPFDLRKACFCVVICVLLYRDMCPFALWYAFFCDLYAGISFVGYNEVQTTDYTYVCRWDNFYHKCSMLVSSKISKMTVWSQPKSGRRGMRIHENIFCRNSSLVTFLSICLIMKWLECDELKSRLVTDNHVWRFKIITRHTLNHWLSVCYAWMWRVTSFCKKTFSGLSAAVCVMRSNMLLCIFCVAI